MNKLIWKFEVLIQREQKISMPRGAKILSIQRQDNRFFLWAEVDPDASNVDRSVLISGTGDYAPIGDYIATVQEDYFVWHFYDGGEHELQT